MHITVSWQAAENIAAITALGQSASAADDVDPFNEESHFALERGLDKAVALVVLADDDVVAAALNPDGEGTSWDLAVAPEQRRNGFATTLLTNIRERYPHAGVWAHGGLPAAAACAEATGWRMGRDLWVMARPLSPQENFDIALPAGFSARTFDGTDAMAQAWLDVNAAAFAHHPEQGRMSMDDFQDRVAQSWFDPAGLIFIYDDADNVAATHWVKREPGSTTGEVYVVAVAPGYQGRGLAKPLTALGLAHLRDVGAKKVELYVEGDNEPAKATYTRAGFSRAAHDVMYVYTPRLSE